MSIRWRWTQIQLLLQDGCGDILSPGFYKIENNKIFD